MLLTSVNNLTASSPFSSQNVQNRQQNSAQDDSPTPANAGERSEEVAEQRELQRLRNADREVRAHELAHIAVGGRYVTSGASFRYERGPDGRLYAVAGEVSIDTSSIPGDPQASLEKALVILRTALAPANPSPQDRRVAAQALAQIQQFRAELMLQDEAAGASGSRLDTFA